MDEYVDSIEYKGDVYQIHDARIPQPPEDSVKRYLAVEGGELVWKEA